MKSSNKFVMVAVIGLIVAGTAVHSLLPTTQRSGSPTTSILVVSNETAEDVTVYVAFQAGSTLKPKHWPFCLPTSELTCQFPLKANGNRSLPLAGRLLLSTLAFNAPVACGATKAELNLNDPAWYDTVDVSLVDGWNVDMAVDVDGTKLGPTKGKTGNELVFGVFPLGCDVCVARQSPPCGIAPGKDGCKPGTQYSPEVPCQFQGTKMGGGSTIRISLVTSTKK